MACIDLATPHEMTIEACTSLTQFSICEQKYLLLLTDVLEKVLTLSRHRYFSIIFFNDFLEVNDTETHPQGS